MNPVHLHLILTHVPVLGTLFAVALLAISLARNRDELKKVALWSFVVLAALSIPLFLTGEPAEEAVENLSGVSKAAIEAHEDAAKVAFGVILSLGAIALGGLALFRRRPMPRWFTLSVLALALATSGLLAWTANLGGKVRHTEVGGGTSAIAGEHD